MVASESSDETLVEPESLESFLRGRLGATNDFAIERHDQGHSNETFFLTWNGRELVLRRPPHGETADSAHDILREYRVLESLQETAVKVPGTILCCEDQSVIGSEFYIVERVAGDVIWEDIPDRFSKPEHRARIGEELVDTLADIHQVDYETVGLQAGEFGYPEEYLQRQVDRWKGQFEWAFEVTQEERDISLVEDLATWFDENLPEEDVHTLVHGDYMLNNVMYGPETTPELVAVFDWELSTLGDPRFDLAWLLTGWWDAKDENPVGLNPTPRTFMAQEGYSTRRELLNRYEEATGTAFTNQRFYRALAVFKRAAVGEMWYRRYLDGNSEKDLYASMGEHVPELVERVQRIIDGDEPL